MGVNEKGHNNKCEKYDQNKFKPIQDCPTNNYLYGAALLENILIAGGYNGNAWLNTLL